MLNEINILMYCSKCDIQLKYLLFFLCFISLSDLQGFFSFNVLFNDALNTFLINGYIGVGNILIGG